MSALDILYRDTVTLFNRHGDEDNLVWIPTVLSRVHFVTDKAAMISQYGENVNDNAMLNVMYRNVNGVPYIGSKRYVTPKVFKNTATVTNLITFQYGDDFDFIYGGTWNSSTSISDASYTKGFFDYMNKNYDEVFAISSVSKYNLITHFTVSAR